MSVGLAPFYMLYEQEVEKNNPDLIDNRDEKSDNEDKQTISAVLVPVHI